MKRSLFVVPVFAGLLFLTACSSSADDAANTASPTDASSSSSSSASGSATASPSGGGETILAVLCDAAAEESVAAIEAALKPDFTVSNLVDVRTDDEGPHAVLGYVEGPGLAVLATWTGSGLGLEGLAAADEFAAQATDVPAAQPDDMTQSLIGQAVSCYTTINSPEESGDKDRDKKKDKDKNNDKNAE